MLLYGRNKPHPWNQPVVPTDQFKLHLNPWPAQRPDDVANPGFDLTRFNVEHWQKYERLLRYAREKDVIVSVIFYIGGQVLPTPFAAGSAEEDLYYRYGVARLAAFSNVTWDLGNEYNFHRPAPAWADQMGAKVKRWDPYDHLCSAHNVTHRTAQSTWCDMQLIQRWDGGQNAFMLGQREEQKKTGRIIPQINEEYGYEDLWEKTPGQRRAETRRRCAWEIALAGCYQTTGESARTGTGVAPDTGGGWVNGRGDDSMTMLADYRRLVEFFTAFDWWTCQPRNDLVEQQLPCLAVEGVRYIVYLSTGGRATIKLSEGKYRARWFNPRTGEYTEAGVATAPSWTSPDTLDGEDWVLLLERDDAAVDRTPPRLIAATAAGPERVEVTFSKSLDPVSACDSANYAMNGNVRVLAAELTDEAGRTVRLRTTPLAEDVRYTLAVQSHPRPGRRTECDAVGAAGDVHPPQPGATVGGFGLQRRSRPDSGQYRRGNRNASDRDVDARLAAVVHGFAGGRRRRVPGLRLETRRVRSRSRQRRSGTLARFEVIHHHGLVELPLARRGARRQPHRPHGRYDGQPRGPGPGRGKEGRIGAGRQRLSGRIAGPQPSERHIRRSERRQRQLAFLRRDLRCHGRK